LLLEGEEGAYEVIDGLAAKSGGEEYEDTAEYVGRGRTDGFPKPGAEYDVEAEPLGEE